MYCIDLYCVTYCYNYWLEVFKPILIAHCGLLLSPGFCKSSYPPTTLLLASFSHVSLSSFNCLSSGFPLKKSCFFAEFTLFIQFDTFPHIIQILPTIQLHCLSLYPRFSGNWTFVIPNSMCGPSSNDLMQHWSLSWLLKSWVFSCDFIIS